MRVLHYVAAGGAWEIQHYFDHAVFLGERRLQKDTWEANSSTKGSFSMQFSKFFSFFFFFEFLGYSNLVPILRCLSTF